MGAAASAPMEADFRRRLVSLLRRRQQWYLDTLDDRAKARGLYGKLAANTDIDADLRTQAYTNLGNALSDAYRLTEAYDYYSLALELDPTNGVARANAAKLLLRSIGTETYEEESILAVAAQHLKTANRHPDRIRELVGELGYQRLVQTLALELPPATLPDLTKADNYQRFVANHRLFLNGTIEGLDLSLFRWDSLRIDGISEGLEAAEGVPPLFAMFNVLKSDYLAARYIAFLSLSGDVVESGNYSDTLDYATYGVETSTLTLAQRACLDLLDKVAVLASAYLGLPGDPERIYFHNAWFEKREGGRTLRWKQLIGEQIVAGNTTLIALSELARDVQNGGFQEHKRAMRHSSTHRFTVLHEIGDSPSRDSPYIDHYEIDYFRSNLIETLQMSRAALIYTFRMVSLHESMHDNGQPKAPLIVPDHDAIRGKDL
jgi:tetratricopeptide (TPR) repeat protein